MFKILNNNIITNMYQAFHLIYYRQHIMMTSEWKFHKFHHIINNKLR